MPNQMNDNNQIIPSDSEEKECVEQLKHWLETEAKFYGRTDEDFLLMFVRGCKMDMEKAKKKLHMYYENRKKVPQWWANRDFRELEPLLQLKGIAVLPDKNPQLPTIGFMQLSKYRVIKTAQVDAFIKHFTVNLEIILRRTNSQKIGFVVIIDLTDSPLWVFQKALSPIVAYNFIQGFLISMPFRVKAMHFFNVPLIGRAAWRLIRALLPPKMRNRFFLYGSDLTELQNNVDVRLLPEEYGGRNGRLIDHAETWLTEVFTYSDYFSEDNKYGFQ